MKILFISFEFPPQGGGIGVYAHQVAKNFKSLGLDVNALVLTHNMSYGSIVAFDKMQDFKIYRFRNYNIYIINVIYRILKALFIIHKNRYDLIFITQFPAGIIGWISRILFKIPYVIVGHGSEALIKSSIRKYFLKFVYNMSDIVILNSKYTYGLFENLSKNKNMYIVYPGADNYLFNKNNVKIDVREKLGLRTSFILLTTGSLSERKGHITVLKALKNLVKDINNIHYLIIGTGPLENFLHEKVKEYNLSENVTFLGHISNEFIPSYYNACDVFILNSTIDSHGDTEGFGIVLIEANLMGKPVIGTEKSGMEEAIENTKTGLLVPMDNPQATAEAIKYFYRNVDKRIKMGEYALERALNNFTWEHTAKRLLTIIKNNLYQ